MGIDEVSTSATQLATRDDADAQTELVAIKLLAQSTSVVTAGRDFQPSSRSAFAAV